MLKKLVVVCAAFGLMAAVASANDHHGKTKKAKKTTHETTTTHEKTTHEKHDGEADEHTESGEHHN